jgi:hypothetical protein
MENCKIVLFVFGALVSSCAMAPSTWASIITSDPSLPATTGAYTESGPVDFSAPGLSIVLTGVEHKPQAGTINITTTGANEFESFNSILTGLFSVNGSPASPFQLTGPVETEVFGKVGMTTGTFNTQMLSLDLSGVIAGHSVQIELNPAQTTTGQTTIASAGPGLYQISSFFDVFTELSLDGGPFIPQANGPTVVSLGPVPEPSTIIAGLMLLLPLGSSGLRMVLKKREA